MNKTNTELFDIDEIKCQHKETHIKQSRIKENKKFPIAITYSCAECGHVSCRYNRTEIFVDWRAILKRTLKKMYSITETDDNYQCPKCKVFASDCYEWFDLRNVVNEEVECPNECGALLIIKGKVVTSHTWEAEVIRDNIYLELD